MSASTPRLSHAEIQELLGAYALDAVDKETAALVEQHLAECVRCSAEVAQHHEVAGLLANSGGASPASLWDGIASQLGSVPPAWEGLAGRLETGGDRGIDPLGESPPGDAGVVPLPTRTRRGQWVRRAATVVGAAAAVLALVLGLQVHHLDNQVTALQSHPSLSAAEQAALQAPSTMVVPLRGAGSSPSPVRAVTVVLTKSGTGFVEAGGLSALPRDRTYQLWGVIGGQTISLGLLGPSPGVVPFSVAGDVAVHGFAITAEHGGGVVHSTNQPVVAGEVSA